MADDWFGARKRKVFLTDAYSPVGQSYDWTDSGVPHPDSPVGQRFDWWSVDAAHPNSPVGKRWGWQLVSEDKPAEGSPVVRACKAEWNSHKSDCSGFVRAVAHDLGITLQGLANDIVDQICRSPWTSLKHDGIAARQKAEAGYFVVAGLKEKPHGHVVVITPGPLAHAKYPTGYWGRLHGTGKMNTTINFAWNKQDRDKVFYSYIAVPEEITP
jgi:hypothetical protein